MASSDSGFFTRFLCGGTAACIAEASAMIRITLMAYCAVVRHPEGGGGVSHSAALAGHGGSARPAIAAAVGSWELGRTQRLPNPSHASQVDITLHVSIFLQVARL